MEASAEVMVGSRLMGFLFGRKRTACTVRDVSVCGFQLVSAIHIPHGSVLSLLVDLPVVSGIQSLKLRGDVRWSGVTDGTGSFFSGIRLRDKPERYVKIWKDLVRGRIRKHFADSDTRRATQA